MNKAFRNDGINSRWTSRYESAVEAVWLLPIVTGNLFTGEVRGFEVRGEQGETVMRVYAWTVCWNALIS